LENYLPEIYHIHTHSGMGFDETGQLYVVINRLHNFVAGRLREDEINFRILRAKTGTLSYVHTGRPSFYEQNILNIGGGSGPIYDVSDNSLGFGGGISSTTPISLGSVGSRFNSAPSRHGQHAIVIIVGLMAFVKYLI
jgi:hypothetical protein